MLNLVAKAGLSASILLLGVSSSARAGGTITGAGATFPAQIYQRWFGMIAGNGGPRVNYQAIGSGSGRKAYLDQTVNFGASDDPIIRRDILKVKRGVVQIPMVGGTIASDTTSRVVI